MKLPEVDSEGDRWDGRWPASAISWHDAVEYGEWRSGRDGREYRLPSAEEWEKAARGVDGRSGSQGGPMQLEVWTLRYDSERGTIDGAALAEFTRGKVVLGVCPWPRRQVPCPTGRDSCRT